MLIAGQVKVNTHLKKFIAVVRCSSKAHLLRNFLLNFIQHIVWSTKVNVTIKASNLQAAQLVLSLAHHVRHTLCSFQITCAIWHN